MSILILTQNLGISNCIITSNFIYISSFSSPSTLSAYFLASFLTQQDGYKPPKVLLKNLTRVHTHLSPWEWTLRWSWESFEQSRSIWQPSSHQRLWTQQRHRATLGYWCRTIPRMFYLTPVGWTKHPRTNQPIERIGRETSRSRYKITKICSLFFVHYFSCFWRFKWYWPISL